MKRFQSFFPFALVFLLFQFSLVVGAENCSCIAFRFSPVQSSYLGKQFQAVLNVFKQEETPFTLGVLPKFFGTDQELLASLVETSKNTKWEVEIAINGLEFEDFTELSQQEQKDKLSEGKKLVEQIARLDPIITFIPPYGKFNLDTVIAAQDVGLTHISSSIGVDSPPFPLSSQAVYRFPAGAFTRNSSIYTENVAVSAEVTWQEALEQLGTYGFAVVDINPLDLADSSENLNQAQINQLSQLIQLAKQANLSIVPVGKINVDSPEDTVLTGRSTAPPEKDCNCVAFRLDDIQDFFLRPAQIEVMNVFKEFGAPLSVGVIASPFGQDPLIVDYTKEVARTSCWDVEFVNHGWVHEDFGELSYEEQIDLFDLSIERVQEILGVTPKTFIPPFNSYNPETIEALKAKGFTYFSSEINLDPPPYDLNNPELWRFPMGASTNDLKVKTHFQGIRHDITFSDIVTQLERDGFAVVMMHPQEFSIRRNQQYTSNINQTMISELRSLLTKVTSEGIRITTIGSINKHFGDTSRQVLVPCSSPKWTFSLSLVIFLIIMLLH